MKRFTATEKWEDPWFRKLEPHWKLFWVYLCDRCDNAGFWKVDMDLASFMVGASLGHVDALRVFDGRIKVISEDVWHVTKFISFQFGDLVATNPCHRGILRLFKERGLRAPTKPPRRGLQAPQEKEEEKEKEKEYRIGGCKGERNNSVSPSMRAHLQKEELARVESAVAKLRAQYDGHQEWAEHDRAKMKELRARAGELKKALGFSV